MTTVQGKKLDICVISFVYPTKQRPEHGVFVRNLVEEWIDCGCRVDVIAPVTLKDFAYDLFRGGFGDAAFPERVIRPLLLTIPRFDPARVAHNRVLRRSGLAVLAARWDAFVGRFNSRVIEFSCARAFKRLAGCYDVIYGKFMMQGAAVAATLVSKNAHPRAIVCADVGESVDWLREIIEKDRDRLLSICQRMDSIFCVSSVHKALLVSLGVDENRIHFATNTVKACFKPMPRSHCRAVLGLPTDTFLAIFVGSFCERKGAYRVLDALNGLDLPIGGVFIGRSRGVGLSGSRVVYCGSVIHQDLPLWLNAADVMVAPSTNEGNSNAINEAMACGLPLITSDVTEIREQVPAVGAVFVDPLDCGQIRAAIAELFHDRDRLAKMSEVNRISARAVNEVSRPRKVLSAIVSKVSSAGGLCGHAGDSV